MSTTNEDILKDAIRKQWSQNPQDKAKRYIRKFFDPTRIGTQIMTKVN